MPVGRRKLATLRGQRTRLGQAIAAELAAGDGLLRSDVGDVGGTRVTADEVEGHIGPLKDLIRKHEDLTLKIAETAEDEEEDDKTSEDAVSSMDLSVSVSKMVSKLQVLHRRLLQVPSSERQSRASTPESTAVQRQLETLLEIERLKVQGETSRRSTFVPGSSQVRLPKIDLMKFAGEIMKWPEFWDSFESAVDRNESRQPVERLNYLRSKLQGEALTTIEGLQTTNENYVVAVQLLKSRYGNTQVLITTHYSKMMDLPSAPNVTSKLRSLCDELEKHLRCLEGLGEDTSHRQFVSLIMAKLPWQLVSKLEESKDEEDEWTVETLRKKMRVHLKAREVADRQCTDNKGYSRSIQHGGASAAFGSHRMATAETLFVGDRDKTKIQRSVSVTKCTFCNGSHWSDEWRKFSTLNQRKKAAKGRCFMCLSDKHFLKNCGTNKKPCWHCKRIGNHHRNLCPKKYSAVSDATTVAVDDDCEAGSEDASSAATHDVLLASGERVLLQTALCEIKSKDGPSQRTRILLDSGSHRSYITERLVKKLKISSTKSEAISIVTFGADRPRSVQTKVSEITLLMKNGSKKTLSVNIVPKITGSISRTPVNIDESNFLWKDIPLADTLPKEAEVASIDCLIGSDYYLELVTSERIQVRKGLYLLGSELGWILTGRIGENSDEVDVSLLIITHTNNSVPHLCHQPALDTCLQVSPSLEDFWRVESIGINDLPERSDDERVLQTFESTVNVYDGRYNVSWSWKDKFTDLPDNYALAYGRFRLTVRRLSQDEGLLQKYSQIIQDQEEKGVVEKVTKADDNTESTLKHYIPHHPVITPNKVRVVYDASAKTKRSDKSLNECLLRGPVILQNLCGLLLRFRLHKVAILADIEKAFLQIGLNSYDRDLTRFFWLKDPRKPEVKGNIQVYRICRVPFGVISSPFPVGATMSHHLSRTHSPLAVDLCRNIYVDNVVSGVPDDSSALSFYKEAKNRMRQASMNLREWTSNSNAFLNIFRQRIRSNPIL